MKFEKIHISGFGELRELELDGISPGLNIIEGANEAGKTTMLEFVRALFFGFAQRDKTNDDAKRYIPKGGAHGGWAIVNNSHNEHLRIERIGGKSSSGTCNVHLLGTDRDINIEVLLNGADRMLYEQIFAFSLDELSDFSSSDTRVQNRIYAASSGKQGEFLLDALKRTTDEADKIYLKSGRKPQLNAALAQFRDLQNHIKELSGQIDEYNTDRDQLLEHQKNADELRKRFAFAKKQLDSAKLHRDVWETWVRLAILRQELNALPPLSEFDRSSATQMTDLRAKLQQQQEAIENLQPRLKHAERDIQECNVNVSVLQNAALIKALKDQLGMYESALRELPLIEQRLAATENQIKVLLEQFGSRWNEENVQEIDTSREPRLQLQRFEKELEEHQRNLNDAVQKESATMQQATQQEQSLQRLQDDIQREFSAPIDQQELQQRADALREVDLLLRKLETQKLREEYLRKELTDKQQQKEERKAPPAPKPYTPWSVFLPMVFAVLAILVLWPQPTFAIWIIVSFTVTSVAIYLVLGGQISRQAQRDNAQFRREQESLDAIIDLRKQLQICAEEVAAADSRLEEIDEKFRWKVKNQADQQLLYEKYSRDRDTRLRYDSQRADAKRRGDDLKDVQELQKLQREKIESYKSTFTDQQQQWKLWLEARHLSAETSPREVGELFDLIEKVREQIRDRKQHQSELASKCQQCAEFENAAKQLWQKLDRIVPPQNQLSGFVRAISDELEKQQTLEIERESLLKVKQQLQDDLATQNHRLQETSKKIEQILVDSDCKDQHDFDTKIEAVNHRDDVQRQCQEQERILETHSAPGAAREKLETALANLDAQSVSEQFDIAQADYAAAEEKTAQAERTQGEWNNKIHQRETSEGKLTALLRELEIQKSTIADLIQQWAAARVTNVLLDCTRERFEQERQPAVIKRAGELMSDVTAGRYQTVLASRGLNAVELDEGEHGRKPLSRWSRGTKEQFYLALRLAFIEDYCSQEHLEPLPVVMDDVLVHSDGYHRLAAASAMIAEFAEKYQVLYFTCRPGDADVLSQASPTAKRFKLKRGKFIDAP